MYGYAGKILRVDLSNNIIDELDTARYVPQFIGGYGLGLKLIWDETVGKPFPSEFDPAAPLVFATGPTAGTPSLHSGRAEVVGIAPQSYPQPWVVASGFGGDFAEKLKFAGYDAILLVGKASSLSYLYVDDKKVEIKDATPMQGLTTIKTQNMLMELYGKHVAIVTIGPAGENQVRIAVILSKTDNSAGQGGFGGVMGSKNLKAIVAGGGSRPVRVARPDVLLAEVARIAKEIPYGNSSGRSLPEQLVNTSEERDIEVGDPTATVDLPDPKVGRWIKRKQSGCSSCGECSMPFQKYYEDVPMHYMGTGMLSGVMHCIGPCSRWLLDGSNKVESGQFEMNTFCDWLGVNQWELFAGMDWFILNAYSAGKLNSLMGEPVTLNSNGPAVYPKPKDQAFIGLRKRLAFDFVNAIAYRQGEGDIFAEGSPRAADRLGLQDIVWRTHKHGYGPHWDGRYLHFVHFPMWIISTLIWSTRGRDPNNITHGAVQSYHRAVKQWGGGPVPYDQLKVIGQKVYGTEYAFAGWPNDADLGYRDKEIVSIWHEHRAIVKASVTVCDQVFPMTWTTLTPDMVGDYTAEIRLFDAVTGLDWGLDEMYVAADRCYNLMRALHVRQGRTRVNDASVIRYFVEQPSYYSDEIQTLDAERFQLLHDRYYQRRGWDPKTGWPTRATLDSLGLSDVADELAREGKLPT